MTSLWEVCSSGRNSGAQSRLVRQAATLLREGAEDDDCADRDESIEDVARQLGYGKSRLYSLFTHEVGMAPNDYRQRVRIKRCCERLTKHVGLGHRHRHRQRLPLLAVLLAGLQEVRRGDADRLSPAVRGNLRRPSS